MGIEDLLGVPPKEFTAARNALVAKLRQAGKSAEAAAARRLRKPTLPVWVVNQVARQRPPDVKAFVSAADDLGRASLGRGSNFKEATGKHQAGLRALLRRAEQILEAAGYRPAAEVMLRVSNTFLGAAADPRARPDLLRGRLREELKPPGLEALLAASGRAPGNVVSLEGARARRARTVEDRDAPRPARTTGEDRETARVAKATAQARKRAEAGARARLRKVEQAEARLRGRAERLERAAATLRARLQAAERDAAAARAAHQQAEEEVRRARESPRG